MTDLRVTQIGDEVAFVGDGTIRISQLGVEVAYNLVPALVVSQLGIEVAWDWSLVTTTQQRVMVMA
jgi:hypothetical protein